MGEMAIGWRGAMKNLTPWTTKFMNLLIEWGRACWTARNGMIYGERCKRYTMERKRLQAEARVYLNAPKEEVLVQIENSRATRKNVRNLLKGEITNWILEQHHWRQKMMMLYMSNVFTV